jgi:DNA processing protein
VRQRLLHLHTALADHWGAMARLLRYDPNLNFLYNLSAQEFSRILLISPKLSTFLFQHLHSPSLTIVQNDLQRNNAFFLTIWDDDYPDLLREIPDPPFVLYGMGKRELLHHPRKIAVVGTRKPSSYGISGIQSILAKLLQEDWLVVSGMAYGIDMVAHLTTLQYDRSTIAVLGGGFDHIYPESNYKKLKTWNNVLLLSEYPPSWQPQRWRFPKRNRIVSGLSKGVIVAEAQSQSGSLITADCALEQNREVFALPGPLSLKTAAGTNHLIQQGAKLVMNAHDILEEFY